MIMKHLKTKNTDPIANQILTQHDLFPNRNLKDIVDSYLLQHPEKKEDQYVETSEIIIDDRLLMSQLLKDVLNWDCRLLIIIMFIKML